MAKAFIVGTKIDITLLDRLDAAVETEGVNRSEWMRGALVYALAHMPAGFAATMSRDDPNQVYTGRTVTVRDGHTDTETGE